MTDEDWRVEVELDDEHHGYSFVERLGGLDLDDEARAQADELTADIRTTRWHPLEEAWKDASLALPRTEAERTREREQRDERERREAEAEGEYDWHVHVRASSRDEAERLEERLRDRQLHVERRWRYLTVGAPNEEQASELASGMRDDFPDADVDVEPSLDLPSPLFMLIRSWL